MSMRTIYSTGREVGIDVALHPHIIPISSPYLKKRGFAPLSYYAPSSGEEVSVMRIPYFVRRVTRGRGTTGQPGISFGE